MHENIINTIRPILKRHDVRKAEIFGSYARGDTHAGSDLDVLIAFSEEKRKSLLDLVSLKFDLEDAVHSKVDLVTYRSVSPRLRKYIMEHRLPVI